MILVSQKAPDFTAPAVLHDDSIINNFNLTQHISGNPAIIFFWPMDFTFVCPSEIIACDKRYNEFTKRNVKIIGISLDSQFVHHAWRQIPINQGGIGKVQFPMVADIKREIILTYGVEHPTLGVALRSSFLIDENGIVRHQIINDLPLGRDFDDLIRMVDAMQFHAKNNLVCPAQWKLGQEGMEPTKKGMIEYMSKNISKL